MVLAVLVMVATAVALYVVSSLGGSKTSSSAPTTTSAAATPRITVTVTTPTPPLGAPVSSEVVLRGAGTQLVVAGGSTAGGKLASGVFTFDTASGKLAAVGQLTSPLADACGALIGGQDVIFGGSSPATVATVQQMPQPGPSANYAATTVVGALPEPRADAAATTVGATTYLVGGDDGNNLIAQVLSTTDGRTWSPIANLAMPARFAAAAAAGTKLYVFGGESISSPTTLFDTIQAVDLETHRASVVGHLPEPLAQASAVTIGDRVFIVGGTSVTRPPGSSGRAPRSSTSTAESAPAPATVATIWSFDPGTAKVTQVGALPVAVAQAGTAVVGSTAWILGGSSNGTPVTSVQAFSVNPPAGSGR